MFCRGDYRATIMTIVMLEVWRIIYDLFVTICKTLWAIKITSIISLYWQLDENIVTDVITLVMIWFL